MDTYSMPARDVRVVGDVDVLVVGGGPAGIAAAISSARSGASTFLAEHYGFLGGGHAFGEIGTFAGLYNNSQAEDVPEFIAGRLNREIVSALRAPTVGLRPQAALTGAQRWFLRTWVEVYDPFWLRLVFDRLVLGAGVNVLLHAHALEPIVSGDRVEGVVFSAKSECIAVRARVVIDCTGDADVVAGAGGGYGLGENGTFMHPSMMFRMFGVDTERLRYVSWPEIQAVMLERGSDYGLNRFFPGVFMTPRTGEVLLNATKVVRPDGGSINGADLWDLTYAEFNGREEVARYERFFRECVPGFERARVNVTGAQVAVRETRLINGLYKLAPDDLLAGRSFEDGIARSAWPMEVMEGDQVSLDWPEDGLVYEVPFRCLVPEKLDGILAAGRCLSAERRAQAGARTFAVCVDMGEAAGCAAALAVKEQQSVRDVDVDVVRRKLGLTGELAKVAA